MLYCPDIVAESLEQGFGGGVTDHRQGTGATASPLDAPVKDLAEPTGVESPGSAHGFDRKA